MLTLVSKVLVENGTSINDNAGRQRLCCVAGNGTASRVDDNGRRGIGASPI